MVKLVVYYSGHPLRKELAEHFVSAARIHGVQADDATDKLVSVQANDKIVVIIVGGTPIPAGLKGAIHWRFDQPNSKLFKGMQSGNCHIWECNRLTYEARLTETEHVSLMPFPINVDLPLKNFLTKANQHCPVDLLLLGGGTPRRLAVVKALGKHGLKVALKANTWGQDKHKALSEAKAVLNIHQFSTGFTEVWRLFEGLRTGCPVISEPSLDAAADAELQGPSIYFTEAIEDVEKLADSIAKCFRNCFLTPLPQMQEHAEQMCLRFHNEFKLALDKEMVRIQNSR